MDESVQRGPVSKDELERRLKRFRHYPAMGGHANVYWDSFVAEVPFRDAAELGRMLRALGWTGALPVDERSATPDVLQIDDFKVSLEVHFQQLGRYTYSSVLLIIWLSELPQGASRAELRRAERVEAMLAGFLSARRGAE